MKPKPVDEIEIYRERLLAPDEGIRRAAVLDLTVIGEPFADRLLIVALSDPSYQIRQIATEGLVEMASNKTIERLTEILRLEDAAPRNGAIEVLVQVGERAVDRVSLLLQDEDSDVRIFASNILARIAAPASYPALQFALSDSHENVRYAVAEALGNLGDPRAVEALLEVMHRDEWIRFPAIEALGKLADPAAIEPLTKLLDQEVWLRFPLVEALGRLGDEATGGLLLAHLEDENIMVGHAVIAALGRIDQRHGTQLLGKLDQTKFIPLLTSALIVEDEAVRKSAVTALGWVGSSDDMFLLLACLDDISEDIRLAAQEAIIRLSKCDICILVDAFADPTCDHRPALAEALGNVGGDEAVAVLIGGLQEDPAGPVRAACATGLGRIADQGAIPALIEAMEDSSHEVRQASARSLGMKKSPRSIRGLLRLLEDPVREVSQEAAQALARFGTREVVTRVAPFVADARSDVRQAAIQSLGLNPHKSADAYILEALNSSSDTAVRRFAASVLGRRHIPRAWHGLSQALDDEDWQVRKLAAEASGLLGDERAMDSLLVALEDNNMWVRYAAVRALGELGAHEAVDALLMALEDEVEPVKLAAVEALGKLGHPRATQALVTLKQHIEYDFRTVVAEALGGIPGAAAFEALVELHSDPHANVRRAVAQALGKRGALSASQPLAVLKKDIDPWVRKAATAALMAIEYG